MYVYLLGDQLHLCTTFVRTFRKKAECPDLASGIELDLGLGCSEAEAVCLYQPVSVLLPTQTGLRAERRHAAVTAPPNTHKHPLCPSVAVRTARVPYIPLCFNMEGVTVDCLRSIHQVYWFKIEEGAEDLNGQNSQIPTDKNSYMQQGCSEPLTLLDPNPTF